jgi:carbamoyl-phosphate synthase large subunit
MAGRSLAEQGIAAEMVPPYYAVKDAVFPFIKFPGADTILGPEMKSTGEVMGVGASFGEAFVKSQMAAGEKLPAAGRVFISVRDADKPRTVDIARALANLGFTLVATRGTAAALGAAGLTVTPVNKVAEGRPHIVDMIKNGEIALIVNTVEEKRTAVRDSYSIRRAALQGRVTLYTTLSGARAACNGMEQSHELRAYAVQALHAKLAEVVH